MAGSAVVNASPLIFLSSAGLVDLLQLISAEVMVPESVATEIEVRGKRDPRAQALASTSWLCGYSNISGTSSNPNLGIRTRESSVSRGRISIPVPRPSTI